MSHLRRLLFALLVLFPLSAQAAELTLHVFDVGQGDAMLLVSPAGKTVLIDAGPPDAADKLAGSRNPRWWRLATRQPKPARRRSWLASFPSVGWQAAGCYPFSCDAVPTGYGREALLV